MEGGNLPDDLKEEMMEAQSQGELLRREEKMLAETAHRGRLRGGR